MNSNKCALLIAVGVLATLSFCSSKDISPAKLHSKYAKLNKYLEENVQSDDPEINMAEIEELFKDESSKSSFLGRKSYAQALGLLTEFAAIPADESICRRWKRAELAEKIDSGLVDESRSKTPNYPLSRVDKIIEHYAFKDASRCGPAPYKVPNTVYAFKQLAYDNIDMRLAEELPETDDVEANMAKAEQMLKGMPDGAIADALRQLLQLKSTLSEDTCNERGYEILFKNQLATRQNVLRERDEATRRVEKIFKHFAMQHEQLCRPVVFRFVKTELKKLDRNTYRSVLGLVSAYYLDPRKYAKLVEEINEKPVSEDYSIPLFVEYANEVLEKWPQDKEYIYLKQISSVDDDKLWLYVKAASVNDPKLKQFDPTEPHNLNHRELKIFLGRYLFEPCARFLKMFKGPVEADMYSQNMNMFHSASKKDKFIEEIAYHAVIAGVQVCKYVYYDRELIYNRLGIDLGAKLQPGASKVHYYDIKFKPDRVEFKRF